MGDRRAKRSLMPEILEDDLKNCIDMTYCKMAMCSPSMPQLKMYGCVRKDWNDYLAGFKHIERKAGIRSPAKCLPDEYPYYKKMVKAHVALAARFGIVHDDDMYT